MAIFLAGGFSIFLMSGGAFASDPDLSALVMKLQDRIDAQNERIRELEVRGTSDPSISMTDLKNDVELLKRQREVDLEIQIKKEVETPIVVASKDGFGLKSKDGNFQIKLKDQIQADGRFYANDGTPVA